MYNEEIKLRYIKEGLGNSSKHEQDVARGVFMLTEPYENEWNADICTQTKESASKVLKQLVGLRVISDMRLRILKSYVKWCVKNNIPNAIDSIIGYKPADHASDDNVEKFRQLTVASPQHLQRFLDSVYRSEDADSHDVIMRCYFWLAWCGVNEDDAIALTNDCVDLDKMVIVVPSGSRYRIYYEAVPSIKKCLSLKVMNIYRERYTLTVARAGGDILLRGSKILTKHLFHNEVARYMRDAKKRDLSSGLGLRLTHYRVWLSGQFFRLFEQEQSGIPLDFMPLATLRVDPNAKCIRERLSKQAKALKRDYESWKIAYYKW